jgi:uncharacterized protein YceH (UPF0502 family)
MRLGAEQGRVIGSLIEKQLTTPQQYPLSLNALVLACNQVSNRDPVVQYDERLVDDTLVSLKDAGLVRFVHPSHGRSVIRYRQVLDERLGLDNQELALVGVLLLRGAQTPGELRSRTERMADFDGVGAIERDLERLGALPEPLVARLSRRPGQKEDRWTQLLMVDAPPSDLGGSGLAALADTTGAAGPVAAFAAAGGPDAAVPPGPAVAARVPPGSPVAGGDQGPRRVDRPAAMTGEVGAWLTEVAALRAEVADLRAWGSEVAALRVEVADLRAALEHLQAELGGS